MLFKFHLICVCDLAVEKLDFQLVLNFSRETESDFTQSRKFAP